MAKVRKTKIGKFLQKIGLAVTKAISKIWNTADPILKDIVGIAVTVVNFLKEGKVDPKVGLVVDLLRHLFKNNEKVLTGMDALKEKLEQILPEVILTVDFLERVVNEDDLEKKLLLIIEKIREGTSEQRKIAYSSMAALLTVKLSDGEAEYDTAYNLTQKYYSGELTA